MKRFLLLFVVTLALTGCGDHNQTSEEAPLDPNSVEGLQSEQNKLKDKQQNTEKLLIKRTVERDTVTSELVQLIRCSNKTPKEIKAELVKEGSELDSQLWFQEIKGTWKKLKFLERDVVVFTRQNERLKKSIVILDQAIEDRIHDDENNSVYVKGEDEELDKLLAQSNVLIQETQWDGLSTGEQIEIDHEVDKFMDESMENNDSKIPGLELKSINELPALPDILSKVQISDQTPKILFGRVKNDCNKIVNKVQEEASDYLKEKHPEAACSCWLEAIKQLNKIVKNADLSDKFSASFFKDYIDALESCQNKTLCIMSKPYFQTFSQCVSEDLEREDPDWDAISESLEGMLRINPKLSQSEVQTMEEKLEIIRTLLSYLIKQNDWDAKVKSKRLETVLDKTEEAVQQSKSEILYNQAKEFCTKKQFDKAFNKIDEALGMYPNNKKFLEEKKTIKQEKAKAEEAARRSNAEELYNQAKEFCTKKQFDKALNKIDEALEMYPTDSKFLEEKQTIEQKKAEAEEAMRKSKAEELYKQAKDFRTKKQYDKSLDRLNEALDMYPTNSTYLEEKQKIAEGFYNQAKEFRTNKQYKEALEKINIAYSLYPTFEKIINEKQEIEEKIQPEAGERMEKIINGVVFAFRWCPAGSFMMGSPEWEEGRNNYGERNKHHVCEKQHKVTLSKGFWMLETEVTQKQWKAIMEYNPSSFNGDDLPVERVSWKECQRFCQRCTEFGLPVQLPTEAQWEYACRAGTTDAFAGKLSEMGWYTSNTGRYGTHQVGMKKPNAWGLYDMHGNVWEWCADLYGDYPSGSDTDPTGPSTGFDRVNRGGSFGNSSAGCRSALRDGNDPGWYSERMGFRCIKEFEILDITPSPAK